MFWLALTFFLVALLGPIGYAALRAWRLWKTMRATANAATEAFGRVMASAETAEKRAVSLTGGTERLSAAITHLQASLEELAAIRAAAAEPRRLIASIRGLVPRK